MTRGPVRDVMRGPVRDVLRDPVRDVRSALNCFRFPSSLPTAKNTGANNCMNILRICVLKQYF